MSPKKKKSKLTAIRSTALWVVVLVACAFLLFANAKQWYLRRVQSTEISQLEDTVAALAREEQSTLALLKDLRSPHFIEREGRERLGYKKEGETTVIFPAVDGGRYGSESEETVSGDNFPYYSAWLQYFFNHD